MIKLMLVAGVGGFVGSCLRYLVGCFTRECYDGDFPLATFSVNVIGCLIIGLVYGLSERTGYLSGTHVVLFATGFCGGFTTFSAFANEALMAGARGNLLLSLGYIAISVIAGIFCVWLGRVIVTGFTATL